MIKNEIRIVKELTFEAAHYLPKYNGKCRALHGHSYKLQIGIRGMVNSETGMVMDFGELKAIIKGLFIDALDHSFLNENLLPFFPNECSTAENMVMWLVDKLSKYFEQANQSIKVDFVRLYETATSYAEWRSGTC